MTPTRSVGQADFFSLSSLSINSTGTSIVRRLASRSVTGNGLGIHVHQHAGFKLHLVWHVFDKHKNKSVKCFEIIFPELNDLYDFCKHLKDGAFQGLCDCVCDHFMEWMDDKINSCTLKHSTQDQLRLSIFLPSTVRSQNRNYFECPCPVSSSYAVGTTIRDCDPDIANLVRYCNLFHST